MKTNHQFAPLWAASILSLCVCLGVAAMVGCSESTRVTAGRNGAPGKNAVSQDAASDDEGLPPVDQQSGDEADRDSDADQTEADEPAGKTDADETASDTASDTDTTADTGDTDESQAEDNTSDRTSKPGGEPADASTDSTADASAEASDTAATETGDAAGTADATAALGQESVPSVTLAQPGEWNQWGGSSVRNNTPQGENIATDWTLGEFDSATGAWMPETAKNIKWVVNLGSQTYGNPVVSGGKVYVGTNNGAGWLARYPKNVDLGCLLCFNEANGEFLWQHLSEKLPQGRVNDWPLQGICCAPLVEGDRLWFVTSRGEVACLDTEGFHDGENDGPFLAEASSNPDEADTVWNFDMMAELRVFQHNMCSCSVTSAGDTLFVCTSNGVDEGHTNIPSTEAPSFLALDKNTGKVLWSDNSPGANILHGQWSSPTYAVIGGVPQVLFCGGDGWLYSFNPAGTPDGKSELLWKFDCNPKRSKYAVAGRSTRNHLIATPVVYQGLVYVAVGEDPEHGVGPGHLWCIDPTKRGDVSTELVFNKSDLEKPIPHKRMQACVEEEGDFTRDNPNSAAVWHYEGQDQNGDGKREEFEEQMHRTCGTVTISNDLLILADFSGLVHCLDAKTGNVHWTHDLLAATWGSALVVDGKVYLGDEEGKITIFKLAPTKEEIGEVSMGNSVYTTPVVANNVLYVANRKNLFAIQEGADATQAAAAAKLTDPDAPSEGPPGDAE